MHRFVLVAVTVLAAACDHTPPAVKKLAEQKLPAAREYVARVSRDCATYPMTGTPPDPGPLGTDPDVLNVQVTCKRVPNLPPFTFAAFLPEPSGNKLGTPYPVGVSKAKDTDPTEQVVVPSFLTTDSSAMDLVVAVNLDKPTYAEVRIAYRAPK
jgi:hypothetical protein